MRLIDADATIEPLKMYLRKFKGDPIACELANEIVDKIIKYIQKQPTIETNKRINLNEIVKFRLTDYGKQIWHFEFETHGGRKPEFDEEGYTELQLWQFMQLFGYHMILGEPEVIEPLELISVDQEAQEKSEEWKN